MKESEIKETLIQFARDMINAKVAGQVDSIVNFAYEKLSKQFTPPSQRGAEEIEKATVDAELRVRALISDAIALKKITPILEKRIEITINLFERAIASQFQGDVKSEGWVSVRERLPKDEKENSIMCLVNDAYWGMVCRPFNQEDNCWDDEDMDDYYTDAVGGKITHWMPLPEPPPTKK
jgi:hypothetical protein